MYRVVRVVGDKVLFTLTEEVPIANWTAGPATVRPGTLNKILSPTTRATLYCTYELTKIELSAENEKNSNFSHSLIPHSLLQDCLCRALAWHGMPPSLLV